MTALAWTLVAMLAPSVVVAIAIIRSREMAIRSLEEQLCESRNATRHYAAEAAAVRSEVADLLRGKKYWSDLQIHEQAAHGKTKKELDDAKEKLTWAITNEKAALKALQSEKDRGFEARRALEKISNAAYKQKAFLEEIIQLAKDYEIPF